MNIEFTIDRWKKYDKNYEIQGKRINDLSSLKNLDQFDIFMLKLEQTHAEIELDTENECDEICIEYNE